MVPYPLSTYRAAGRGEVCRGFAPGMESPRTRQLLRELAEERGSHGTRVAHYDDRLRVSGALTHLPSEKAGPSMSGRHSFAALRSRMSSEAQAQSAAEAQRLGQEMVLASVRRAMQLS